MHDSGAGEPDGQEHGAQLAQADRVGRSQDVQELQHVRHRHERERAQEAHTCSVHRKRLSDSSPNAAHLTQWIHCVRC